MLKIKEHSNTELLRSNLEGKNVLVLGSGPSAREVDWKKTNWDALVTTSFFYLNNEVVNRKPVHVTLSDIVDLENEILLTFLDNNPTTSIGFEPKVHPFYSTSVYRSFCQKYKSRIIDYYVPGGKEGVAGRVCWLVLECNPRSLTLCGIDGVSKERERDPQNYFREHSGTADNYSYDDYLYSFQQFGRKLKKVCNEKGIEVKNLGEGKPYNMITGTLV